MSEPRLVVVYGADIARTITTDDIERSDWPRVYVRAAGIAAFRADSALWRLLAEGPPPHFR